MVETLKIKKISGREILDSRGFPTVEAELVTELGSFFASVPSGTSKGKNEALELRDGGERYQGLGVLGAVNNINEIIGPKLEGKEVANQKEIDDFLIDLDGTENKSKLGANAILAVSIAVSRAGAALQGKPLWNWIAEISGSKPSLPSPCVLFMEGGMHGKGSLDVQEIMVILRASTFKERLRVSTEIYHNLGKLLEKKYGKASATVGMEGAFTPLIDDTEEALDLIMKTIKDSGYKDVVGIILDMAASCFFQEGKYFFDGGILGKDELMDYYLKLCEKYPITGIEDPFAEDDWSAFREITQKIGDRVSVIGDDLLATNIERIKTAIEKKACNGLVLKANQVGTVTETIEAAKYAAKNNFKVFVKHRSGETKDDFIADLAAGLGMGYIMAGAPTRGERVAKYNRLLKIEEEMKNG